MANQSYAVPGLVLGPGGGFSQQVQDFQRDLRALGYISGPIDGEFGNGTVKAIAALTYDLQHNDGGGSDGHAPVAITSYNQGGITGQADQTLVACMAAMLDDGNYPKLPSSGDPVGDNQRALAAVRAIQGCAVPLPFLLAIMNQESGQRHYQVPARGNIDNFVTIGLDRNDKNNPSRITSRGYGIGQYTLFHHPPTLDEVNGFILDPVKNLSTTISELREKYQNWVNGPKDTASDRTAELGTGALIPCKYDSDDPKFQTDCVNCMKDAPAMTITAGTTPFYAGAAAGDVYAQTQYHVGSYSNVPQRDKIGCDWPYAARRFNGSGVNSFDYQAEFLLKVMAQR
jgi:peptidoglycan hydrolase-like protein with peptidoglycan-binding domain